MTTSKSNTVSLSAKEWGSGDRDLMKSLMKEALEEVLEAEMTEFLGAAPNERSETRSGYRAGYYHRGLVTRIGKLTLRVPRDRSGKFSTALFERYTRSEKALVAPLAEMYVQGVSTHKVKAVTEELCGHSFSASAISSINKSLDEALERFANRQLEEAYPYVILGALREGARGCGDPLDGGADRHRHQLGGAAPNAGGRDGQPGEPEQLEGLPAAAQGAWAHRRGVRGLGRPARLAGSQSRFCGVNHEVAGQVPEARRLGREQHRRDLELLPVAPGAPQALEEHQHAGAAQRGDQTAHARGEDLPEQRVVSAAHSGAVRRNPRDVARAQPLPEHGPAGRAEEGAVATGRLTAAVVGTPGWALRTDHGNPESTDYLINLFAQLDARYYLLRDLLPQVCAHAGRTRKRKAPEGAFRFRDSRPLRRALHSDDAMQPGQPVRSRAERARPAPAHR